jgi:hypothetical protein
MYQMFPKAGPQTFVPDDNYELIPAQPVAKKGVQCGQCGMKFDHGKAYGFYCGNVNCQCQLKATC